MWFLSDEMDNRLPLYTKIMSGISVFLAEQLTAPTSLFFILKDGERIVKANENKAHLRLDLTQQMYNLQKW